MARWLNEWLVNFLETNFNRERDPNRSKTVGKSAGGKKDDGSNFKACLISGPPGIGKTTAATIIAKECGYDILELNASDARNKASIDVSFSSYYVNNTRTESHENLN